LKKVSAKPEKKEGVFQRERKCYYSGHINLEPWSFGAAY
jgi:hypothetical protein